MLGSNCSIDITQNILEKQTPPPKTIDPIRNIGWVSSVMSTASSLARKSKLFEPMHRITNNKIKMRNFLMAEHEEMLHELNLLPDQSREKINAVLEYLRLSRTPVRDTGRPFSIKTREMFREGKDGIERRVVPALSKPGQVLKLDANETRLLNEIRGFLESRYTLNAKSILSAMGYDGNYSRESIMNTVEDEAFRDDLLRLFDALEKRRITSYIPFMRSGDTRIMVYGPDGSLESGAFRMLDSLEWLKDIVGPKIAATIPDPNVDQKIKEIQAKYPASEGYNVVVSRMGADMTERLSIDDLSSLDKLLNLMDARSGEMVKRYFDKTLGGMFSEDTVESVSSKDAAAIAQGFIADLDKNVRSVLMDDLIAGFMKESRDIPGYDTNFTDRLLDYNRIVATTVSDRMFRKDYSAAYDNLKRKASPLEKKYAAKWDEYVDNPESAILRGLRTIGFYGSMWASVASSAINAMSVWTVTAPQMTIMKASAGLDVYRMAIQTMGGFRGAVGYGLHIDPEKIPGLTREERDVLKLANKRGTTRAQMNPELMGVEAGIGLAKAGPLKKRLARYFQYGSSAVSVTEELNKNAAFIVAYRYAKDPKALANWKEAYKDDERAQAIMERGSDPFDVAEFMVETVTFMGGQIEKAPAMRRAGGVVFQFSQYPLNIMSLLNRNFTKQGPRGKMAGTFLLLSTWTVAGLLFAIPLGDDAVNVFEWISKTIFGKDFDVRTEAQMMLAEMFGNGEEGRRSAEAILYGPTRALTGLNIGQRVGFTSLWPELQSPASIVPAISTTFGRIDEYLDRRASGVQPVSAYTSLISPLIGKGPTDLLKGFVQYPEEGVRTRYGKITKPPSEMNWFERFARGTGFQSASIAREQQARQAERRIEQSTLNAQRNNTLRLGKMLADAIAAEDKGNTAEAERIRAQFEVEIQAIADAAQKMVDAGKLDKVIMPPSEQTLKDAVMEELYPEMRLDNVGKMKREAVAKARQTLLVEDDEDDEDLFTDEEEDEDAPLLIQEMP
jgi:hypothetical protein